MCDTPNLTPRWSLDHWKQWQSSTVKLVKILPYTLCICLYFCSSCLYIFTYMNKFSLKMTISTCVRNSWEDTIAALLLWKILTWKCFFLCKNAQYARLLGLTLVIPRCKTDHSVGRFCLLLCVYEIWYRVCLVVALWVHLRELWACAFWGLDLTFSFFISFLFCCSIACLVSGCSGLLGYPFRSSMCQIILIIVIIELQYCLTLSY